MTTPQDPECECAITPEMAWAGPALALCHHSPAALATETREKLLDMMGDFSQNIDPNAMFKKTIIELAGDYRRQVAGKMERMLSQDEHLVININFMRSLSLAAEMLMCTMIIQRNGEEAGPGNAETG